MLALPQACEFASDMHALVAYNTAHIRISAKRTGKAIALQMDGGLDAVERLMIKSRMQESNLHQYFRSVTLNNRTAT